MTQIALELPVTTKLAKLAALLGWWTARPRPRDLAIALLLALPVPLVMALSPDVVMNYTFHDVFIPLDAAWRILQGQWPHTDVYSPLGLAYFWMHGAAAWLGGMDGRVVVWANFVALPFVLVPALVVGWRRLNVFSCIALVLLVTMLVTSPVFIDGPARVIAHLANYNRIGDAACAVVCVWALCPPSAGPRRQGTAEALLVGLLLLILLYLKVTFFALALLTAGAGCCLAGGSWRATAIAGSVVAAGVLALEWLHPGLLLAYVSDIRRAGAASTALFRGTYTSDAVFQNLVPGLSVGTVALALAWIDPRQRWAVVAVLAVAGACILVATQNLGAFSPPLAALTIVLAQRIQSSVRNAVASPATGQAVVLACIFGVALSVMPFLTAQAAGVIYQAAVIKRSTGARLGGNGWESLRDMLWLADPVDRGQVPDGVNFEEAARWKAMLPFDLARDVLADGFGLLGRESLTRRRIANLMFSNPFPAGLGAPSPRGTALWWDEGRSFRPGHLTADNVLGDADVVMVPKIWYDYYDVTDLLAVVKPRLDRDFTPHESRYWTAWVKR